VSGELEREDIALLLKEGYTVHIDITLRPHDDIDGLPQYHVVTVKDGDRVVNTGESWLFSEAMMSAYMHTPEKPEAEQGRLL
jgi:hypothetical protein